LTIAIDPSTGDCGQVNINRQREATASPGKAKDVGIAEGLAAATLIKALHDCFTVVCAISPMRLSYSLSLSLIA
jgi:hypothetical protein